MNIFVYFFVRMIRLKKGMDKSFFDLFDAGALIKKDSSGSAEKIKIVKPVIHPLLLRFYPKRRFFRFSINFPKL